MLIIYPFQQYHAILIGLKNFLRNPKPSRLPVPFTRFPLRLSLRPGGAPHGTGSPATLMSWQGGPHIDFTKDLSLFDIKQLKQSKETQRVYYRLRKGKYRAIFYLESSDIFVIAVGKREEVYKKWQ